MDQPLFGEESAKSKALTYAIILSSVGLVGECVIFSIIKGIKDAQYIPFALLMLLMCLTPILLYRWYKNDDLENKYLMLTIYCIITIWVAGISLNILLLCCRTKPCSGLFNSQTKQCLPLCDCPSCLIFVNGTGSCQATMNCSDACNTTTSEFPRIKFDDDPIKTNFTNSTFDHQLWFANENQQSSQGPSESSRMEDGSSLAEDGVNPANALLDLINALFGLPRKSKVVA